MTVDPGKYLEYLDKEMTIMGILSAFSAATAALVTDHFFAADKGFYYDAMQNSDAKMYVLAGGSLAIIAAAFFYLQRSLLAWYYGQIALKVSLDLTGKGGIAGLLVEADGWGTWVRYQTGCIVLGFSLLYYAFAVFDASGQSFWTCLLLWLLNSSFAVAVIVLTLRWYVLESYLQSEYPFDDWTSDPQRNWPEKILSKAFEALKRFYESFKSRKKQGAKRSPRKRRPAANG